MLVRDETVMLDIRRILIAKIIFLYTSIRYRIDSYIDSIYIQLRIVISV